MKIYGLQKMTLLDFPGRVSCTIFLNGCDFRCPFCHNYELAEGKAAAVMEEEELLDFLKKRQGLLDGVAVTGGEPCLHAGLADLLARIRQMHYAIKLDSNGYHPQRLRDLIGRGLVDYVAMDIKNSPEKYAMTAGLRKEFDLSPIKESISVLMNSEIDYEFRTTVVKELHEAEDFRKMGEMIRGAKKYFLQAFTDRESVPFEGFHAPAPEEMKEHLAIVSEYVLQAELRGVE